MLVDVKCPQCRDVIPVTESVGEQKIDCPACGENFTVPGAGKTNPKPAPESKAKPKDRDEPRSKKSARRSRRDDDDEDDRPKRREEDGSGGMVGLLVFGGIGLAILAVGFGITAWLIFSPKSEPDVAENKAKTENKATNPVPNRNTAPNNTTPPNGKNQPGLPAGPFEADPPLRPKGGQPANEDPVPPEKFPKAEPPRPMRPEKPDPADAPPPAPAAPAVMLPAAAEQVALGAGGKLLFLHLKANRQVAVFDPAEKKVVKYVPASDDEVLLAAGRDHLILGYPKLKKIERVSLATFEMEKAMDVPSKWPLRAIGLGANATGPLLAACGDFPFGDEFFLIDLAVMKRYTYDTVIKNPGVHPDAATRIWAAHDGRTFSATSGGLSKPHAYQMRTTGWLVSASPCNPPLLGADGEMVFGGGQIATVNGQAIGEKRGDRGKSVWYFPAAQGPFFLSLNERTFGQWPNEKKFPELQVHVGRDQRALVTLPELPELKDFADFFFQQAKPLDQHVFFLPNSNALAILPVTRDRIHLRTLDVKAELAKTSIEYLVVASRPPIVKIGETFRYKPDVWSKKGGVKLRLDAGPAGMKLEGDTLVWPVPSRTNQPPANVILSVSDDSGQELFHTFEVTVFVK